MNNRRYGYYLACSVAVVTFVVYLPALRNGFLWDDFEYVVNNVQIRALDWAFLEWAVTSVARTYWQPLTWISHAIDYAIWGPNPLGFHLTNIALHAGNTFLVVFLVLRLVEAHSRFSMPVAAEAAVGPATVLAARAGRFSLVAAGATGIIFGLHPLHVESVAWISERKDVLYSFFFLLSLLCYINFIFAREGGTVSIGVRGYLSDKWFLFSFAFFMLSLLSKPMAVTLPLILLIVDWYPFRRIHSLKAVASRVAEKLPFILLGLGVSALTFWQQEYVGAMVPLAQMPLTGRIIVVAKALVLYLWKMMAPFNLLPYYYLSPSAVPGFSAGSMLALVFICGTSAVCLIFRRRQNTFSAVWGYYLVTLLPVSGIVMVGPISMADRYAYLPSLGPFLLLGVGAAWLWMVVDSLKWARTGARVLFATVAVSLCISLGYLTIKQIAIWKNGIALWSYVIEKEPNNSPVAYASRGVLFFESRQFDKALADFNASISLEPSHGAYLNRGLTYRAMGRLDLAMEDISRAISMAPAYGDAYAARGWIYSEMGLIDRTLEDYNTAITLNPTSYLVYNDRGRVYQETGRPDLAVEDFTTSLTLNPSCAQTYVNRGLAFEQTGLVSRALEDYTSAINADLSFADAYNNRGLLFQRMGQPARAIDDLNNAIRLNPAGGEAFNNRGLAYEDMGKYELAIEDYGRAIELKPDDPVAYNNRGIVFGKMGDMIRAKKDYQRACDFGSHTACESARKGGSR